MKLNPGKYCDVEGCKTIASFGFPEQKRTNCSNHKLKNMINLVSKICEVEGCNHWASYGYEQGKKTFEVQ